MELSKSSRYSKIAGDFGESLVLYWLSKYGFECALMDHTCIDIIARDPNKKDVLGISVKTRFQDKGTETDSLSIENKYFQGVARACEYFHCRPYFAIVIGADNRIMAFILSMDEFKKFAPQGKSVSSWKLTPNTSRNIRTIQKLKLSSSPTKLFTGFNQMTLDYNCRPSPT